MGTFCGQGAWKGGRRGAMHLVPIQVSQFRRTSDLLMKAAHCLLAAHHPRYLLRHETNYPPAAQLDRRPVAVLQMWRRSPVGRSAAAAERPARTEAMHGILVAAEGAQHQPSAVPSFAKCAGSPSPGAAAPPPGGMPPLPASELSAPHRPAVCRLVDRRKAGYEQPGLLFLSRFPILLGAQKWQPCPLAGRQATVARYPSARM